MRNKRLNNARANAHTAFLRATLRLVRMGSVPAVNTARMMVIGAPMPTLVGGLDAAVSRSVYDRLHRADAALRAALIAIDVSISA